MANGEKECSRSQGGPTCCRCHFVLVAGAAAHAVVALGADKFSLRLAWGVSAVEDAIVAKGADMMRR